MKAMAVVAHPDDCVIFAYSYIHNNPQYDWTICYLTYTQHDPRGREFKDFWHRRGIATVFLGFEDVWNHEQNCPGLIDFDSACQSIQRVIADQALVVTHDQKGDYGHPHHVLVHQATIGHPNRVLFAGPGQGTIKYSIDPKNYTADELPLHWTIIVGFHATQHINEYTT